MHRGRFNEAAYVTSVNGKSGAVGISSPDASVTVGSGAPNDVTLETSGGGGTGENYVNQATSTSITSGNTNTVYDNTGASALAVITLPAAARGIKYTFLINNANGYRLKAVGSDVIDIGGSLSSAAGTQTCTKVGGAVVIYGLPGVWIAAAAMSTWINA